MKLFVRSLFRGFSSARFAGALVEQPRNVVELGSTGFAEVRALGRELAHHTFGVLIAAVLPRRLRVSISQRSCHLDANSKWPS